ncbi:hypothetical protein [Candidatus Nitrosopumilus sp. SW]|nr:hypothetical protein [Candidatus Nitrosopumilus sp. SW]
MVQLHISNETKRRMENIVGITNTRDGDYFVNNLIDILEKKARQR